MRRCSCPWVCTLDRLRSGAVTLAQGHGKLKRRRTWNCVLRISPGVTRLQNHANSALWAKSDRRESLNGLTGDDWESEALRDRGQQQYSLHHRKSRAHTHPRTSAKRKIRKSRQRDVPRIVCFPGAGVKSLGFRKVSGVPLRDELRHQDVRFGREFVIS